MSVCTMLLRTVLTCSQSPTTHTDTIRSVTHMAYRGMAMTQHQQTHRKEAVRCGADVVEPHLVEQDLLHDECRHLTTHASHRVMGRRPGLIDSRSSSARGIDSPDRRRTTCLQELPFLPSWTARSRSP